MRSTTWGSSRRVRRAARFAFAVGALAAGASACFDDITGVRELSITVSSAQSIVSVGDSVLIEFEAAGTGLRNVRLEFGDGTVETIEFSGGFEAPNELPENGQPRDTLFYPGPVSGGGWRYHAFESPGTFRVVGFALAGAGIASDTVDITVN
jgi:hypothetical protein